MEVNDVHSFGEASRTDLELSGMFEMSNRSDCGHASYRVSCTGRKIKGGRVREQVTFACGS